MDDSRVSEVSVAARVAVASASDICSTTDITVLRGGSYRIRARCDDGDMEFLEEQDGYYVSIALHGKPPIKRYTGVSIVSERVHPLTFLIVSPFDGLRLLFGTMHRVIWLGSDRFSCFICGMDDELMHNLPREKIEKIDELLKLNVKDGRAVVRFAVDACSLYVSRMTAREIVATIAQSVRQFLELQLWKTAYHRNNT